MFADQRHNLYRLSTLLAAVTSSLLLLGIWTRSARQPSDAIASQPVAFRDVPVIVAAARRQDSAGSEAAAASTFPRRPKLRIADCLHLILVDGAEAMMPIGESRTTSVLDVLTNAAASQHYFGQPACVETLWGLRFPTQSRKSADNTATEAHRDQCLATFGEMGVSLSRPVEIGERRYSLRDVLRDSVANFHLRQEEIEWTVLAYALYLPPTKSWRNRFGEQFSFDDVADELMNRSLYRQSCGGAHVLYSANMLYRVDDQFPVLARSAKARLREFLRRAAETAVNTQDADGSWPVAWSRQLNGADPGIQLTWTPDDTNLGRVLATGHVAQFLLRLPDELQVAASVHERAADWLAEQWHIASQQQIFDSYCPYAHAYIVARDARGAVMPPREELSAANSAGAEP